MLHPTLCTMSHVAHLRSNCHAALLKAAQLDPTMAAPFAMLGDYYKEVSMPLLWQVLMAVAAHRLLLTPRAPSSAGPRQLN